MCYRCGRVWLIGLIVAALLGGIGYSSAAAQLQLEEINIPVLISGSIPSGWGLGTYPPRSFTVHFQRGEKIILSSLPDGTGNILVRAELSIKVIHPDGTQAGKEFAFCSSSCACTELPPQEITSLFEPGKNRVTATLRSGSGCGPITSTDLYLVEFTKTSASRLIRRMTRETAQLQWESAGVKNSWDTRSITRKLDLAVRYTNRCASRPRLCKIAQAFLDKAIDHLNGIDFGGLLEQVKEGLPELRGEIEALIKLNDVVEEPGKEALTELGDLHKLLCRMNPPASDCGGLILHPIIWPWPEIKNELEQIIELLKGAREAIPLDPAEAIRAIREARSSPPLPLGELEDDWGEIDEHLTQIRNKVRLMQIALRRGRRYSLGAQDRGHLSFELHPNPNPIGMGLPIEVDVRGTDVEGIELQLFALDGKLILARRAEGNYLQFIPLDGQGRPLANGIYLYVVIVRGQDGSTIRSKVRKLAILR